MNLAPELQQTLAIIADAAADASEPWWIIGSAAVALHGAPVSEVRDVDLLMSVGDARWLMDRLEVQPEPASNHPRFRSEVFATWRGPPLPVEIFAGFRLRSDGGWRPVKLETREGVTVAGRILFVPSARELHHLLLSFGRPKDLDRARVLRTY